MPEDTMIRPGCSTSEDAMLAMMCCQRATDRGMPQRYGSPSQEKIVMNVR